MLDKNLNNPINWKSNLLPNYQDMNNPLHSACRDGNVEQLKLLLNNLQSNVSNADLLIAEDSSYNWTAGHFAAYFGKVECLRLLQQASSVYNSSRLSVGLPALACPITVSSSTCGQSLLHIAAFANHRHCVQWLLEAGLPLDHQDSAGNTALHFAARSGALPCVQLLLSHKPSLSAAASAAEVAWEAGHRDVAGCIRQSVQAGSAAIGSVNHLVSSNGYYGYQATHATTLSNHHTLNGVGDAGMDMETEAPSVVPVKRIREEEAAQQAKRARFEGGPWPTIANTTTPTTPVTRDALSDGCQVTGDDFTNGGTTSDDPARLGTLATRRTHTNSSDSQDSGIASLASMEEEMIANADMDSLKYGTYCDSTKESSCSDGGGGSVFCEGPCLPAPTRLSDDYANDTNDTTDRLPSTYTTGAFSGCHIPAPSHLLPCQPMTSSTNKRIGLAGHYF